MKAIALKITALAVLVLVHVYVFAVYFVGSIWVLVMLGFDGFGVGVIGIVAYVYGVNASREWRWVRVPLAVLLSHPRSQAPQPPAVRPRSDR